MNPFSNTNLKKPELVVIDLMNTIMFQHDRFGPQEPYLMTYNALGGQKLDSQDLHQIIARGLEQIEIEYESATDSREPSPTILDAHFHLREEARRLKLELGLKDRIALNLTFAFHECGWIDRLHVDSLSRLSSNYPVVVLSNLWGMPFFCNLVMERSGAKKSLEGIYYSSEIRRLKPCRDAFHHVCSAHDVSPENSLMIGDNIDLDIIAASEAGLQGMWLSYGRDLGSRQDKVDAMALDFPDAVNMILSHT